MKNFSFRLFVALFGIVLSVLSAAQKVDVQQIHRYSQIKIPVNASGDGDVLHLDFDWTEVIGTKPKQEVINKILDLGIYSITFSGPTSEMSKDESVALRLLGSYFRNSAGAQYVEIAFEVPKELARREYRSAGTKYKIVISAVNGIGKDSGNYGGQDGDERTLDSLSDANQGRFQWDGGISGFGATPMIEANVQFASRVSDSRLLGVHFHKFKLDANLPIKEPSDTHDDGVSGNADASGKVADRIAATYQLRMAGRQSVYGIGGAYRQTGSGKGREVVAQSFVDFMNETTGGALRVGLEGEWGVRSGDAEWANLTNLANPGREVLRFGGVVEWAPRLGQVNANLGEGLRFYVRGRLWQDRARNSDGDFAWRTRHFIDSELFLNLNLQHRVYLRFEEGWVPPDFGRRTRSFSLGYGVAF